MAYQNWFNQAANTSAVSSNVPPALVPSQSSVLDTQPVPSSYTTNRQAGSNISTMPQINQIMGVSTGGINTSMFPGTGPNSGGSGTGGGNAPSSWSGYSSGGSTGPSTPGGGTNNPGVTQNWNESEGGGPIGWGSHTTIANTNNPNSISQQQMTQLSQEAQYNYGNPNSSWHNATSDANNDGTINWWDSQVGGVLGGSWENLGNNFLNSLTGGLFNFGGGNRN